MPAQKGNNYAEKWTKGKTLSTLEAIEKEARKPSCLWLGSALVTVGLYRDLWAYWKEKFSRDNEVFRSIKKIEQIFEDRLFTNAIKGDAQSTIAIFGLKNNHGWKDKSEIDHTTAGKRMNSINVNIVNATDPVTDEDDINEDI